MLLSYLTIMMPNPNARLTLPRDEGLVILLKAFTAPQEHFHVQILFRVYVCPMFHLFSVRFFKIMSYTTEFLYIVTTLTRHFPSFLHVTVVAQ